MTLLFIVLFSLIVVAMIVLTVISFRNLKVCDTLLLRFMEVNQQFYTNQNTLVKNEQYLINKMGESVSHLSLISKSVEKLDSLSRDFKREIDRLHSSNIKNLSLKGVNNVKEINEKSNVGNKVNTQGTGK